MTRRIVAICGMALAISTVATAQPSAPRLDDLLSGLSSDSFAQREASTEALVAATNIDDASLVRTLKSGTLDAEASRRVHEALRRRFFGTVRAAIGIGFATEVGDARNPVGAPTVGTVDETLPAGRAGLIKPGDEFLEADGHVLSSRFNPSGQELLRAAVFSRLPGESIPVKIRRPAPAPVIDDAGDLAQPAPQIIELDLPLGRYDQMRTGPLGQLQLQPRRAIVNGQNPVVLVDPVNQPKQPQQAQPAIPEPRFPPGAASPEEPSLTAAWYYFLDRTGVGLTFEPARADARVTDWNKAGSGYATGRSMLRGGGRIIAGPVDVGLTAAQVLRDQMNTDRNVEVLRALAAGEAGVVAVPQNPQQARIVRLQGPGAGNVRIVGRDGETGQRTTRLMDEEQFQSVCQGMAAEIALIEQELRDLASQRVAAASDLSMVQLVDERIAGLRTRWEQVRAQAAAMAEISEPEPRTSAFQ